MLFKELFCGDLPECGYETVSDISKCNCTNETFVCGIAFRRNADNLP